MGFPLGLFVATRLAYFAFAAAGTSMGLPVGATPQGSEAFARSFPTLAASGHGQPGRFVGPLVPWLSSFLETAGQSAAAWLTLFAQLAGALTFVTLYSLFKERSDSRAATAGLSLLAASPFAYVLAEGGPLALGTALASTAALATVRGRPLAAVVLTTMGTLAHPVALIAAPPVLWGALPPAARKPLSLVLIAPAVALAAWGYLGPERPSQPVLVGPFVWMATVWWIFVGIGVLLTAVHPRTRAFAPAAALAFAILITTDGTLGQGLAACWPAFLPLGIFLAPRHAAYLSCVIVLSTWQGLLFYLHTHWAVAL